MNKNQFYVVFNEDGFLSASFQSDAYEEPESIIPKTAIELSKSEWEDLYENQAFRRYTNGKIVEYTPPTPEIEPGIIILPSVTLWERMTEAEAEQVAAAMETQSFRTRQIFNSASTYRSDHELWPLLEQMATELFGDARAAELLAP